jgi:hypothetical protein
MTLSKKTLSVAVAGLASLTWIGVSAASEDDDPVLDDQVEEIVDDTTTTTETEVEAEEADTTEGEPEAADSAAGEHPENHGRYVAEAAHTCAEGPGHGECVRAVAQSDAGRPALSDESTGDEAPEPEAAEVSDDADEDEESEGATAEHGRSASGGTSAGHGEGHAKG